MSSRKIIEFQTDNHSQRVVKVNIDWSNRQTESSEYNLDPEQNEVSSGKFSDIHFATHSAQPHSRTLRTSNGRDRAIGPTTVKAWPTAKSVKRRVGKRIIAVDVRMTWDRSRLKLFL